MEQTSRKYMSDAGSIPVVDLPRRWPTSLAMRGSVQHGASMIRTKKEVPKKVIEKPLSSPPNVVQQTEGLEKKYWLLQQEYLAKEKELEEQRKLIETWLKERQESPLAIISHSLLEAITDPLKEAARFIASAFSQSKQRELPLSETPRERDLKRFHRLRVEWENETGHLSFLEQRIKHPAFLKIIGMGEKAIPYLINDLRQRKHRRYWLFVLNQIVDESNNPTQRSDKGNLEALSQLWIDWYNK